MSDIEAADDAAPPTTPEIEPVDAEGPEGDESIDASGSPEPGGGVDVEPAAPFPEAPTFILTRLHSVVFELPSPSPILKLLELELPYRILHIPVGLPEAQAIATANDSIDSPRPLTHELFAAVLRDVGVDVVALRIVSIKDGVYFAELDLMGPRGRMVVDCRPTDGVILALRQRPTAPILVEESLLGD